MDNKKKARKNLKPAAKNGGNEARPIFIAIQVELQIAQSRVKVKKGKYFLEIIFIC